MSHDQIPYFPMPADSEAAGQYIEPQEFKAIRAHLQDGTRRNSKNGGPKSDSNLQSFFMFLYATGCRLGAAQKITWKDVDKDCTMISIPQWDEEQATVATAVEWRVVGATRSRSPQTVSGR